jgi:predicted permease
MSTLGIKFAATAVVVIAGMAGGYVCRRQRWLSEKVGEFIMTFVAVLGYPAVGFLTLWGTVFHRNDVAMPLLAVTHAALMTFLSLALSGYFTDDRPEQGLFAVAGGLGNNGFTMGAFVLYLLYGEEGLGIANIYFILFVPVVVLIMYPLARHYATEQPKGSMLELIYHSLLDWRSIGLPISLLGIVFSAAGVARPPIVVTWHLVDGLVYILTPLAFFGIGLRLHFSRIIPLWRMILGLALVRFGLAAVVGVALACATWLTPWPFHGLRWNVFVVEGFVPTAVTMVAVANMFGLRPREASVLFVVNTTMYLVLVLPVVWWLFG